MKFALFLASLALAPLASAAPGSYSVLTFALTASASFDVPDVVLKNGNKQQGLKEQTVRVTNATILSEAQSQGYLTAGSLEGWQIVAVYDADNFRGFYAKKPGQSVAIPGVISVLTDFQGGTESGKWIRNTQGNLISGTKTNKEVVLISITLGGTEYVGSVLVSSVEKIYDMGTGIIWATQPFKTSSFASAGDDGSIMGGTISGKAGVRLAVIEAEFPQLAN